MSTRASPTVSSTPTCESGSGWQSGMRLLVCFAAMIPASWAVVRASPFGRSWMRRAVSGAISTVARAIALRRESGLCPTSTILTSPEDSSTCERSVIARMLLRRGHAAETIEIVELVVCPRANVVLADVVRECRRAAVPLLLRHRQRPVEAFRHALDVERVDRDRPLAEPLV